MIERPEFYANPRTRLTPWPCNQKNSRPSFYCACVHETRMVRLLGSAGTPLVIALALVGWACCFHCFLPSWPRSWLLRCWPTFCAHGEQLESRGISRTWGTLFAVLTLLLAIALFLLIVLPLFYKEAAQLSAQIPGFVENSKRAIPGPTRRLELRLRLMRPVPPIRDRQPHRCVRHCQTRGFFGGGRYGVDRFPDQPGPDSRCALLCAARLAANPARIGGVVPRTMHVTVTTIVKEIDAILSEFAWATVGHAP